MVSRLIESSQGKQQLDRPEYMWHHDQQASVKISFMKYLQSMVRVIDGIGKKKARPACPRHEGNCNTYSPGSSCGAFKMGKLQFEDFVRERLVERTSPLVSIFKETS